MNYLFKISRIYQNIDFITVANYCLIGYAFLLPLSSKLASKMIYPIIICLILSGQFKERLLFIIQNKIIQSFFYMLATYIIWTLGSDHLDTALFAIGKLSKLLFIMLIIALCVHTKFIYRILQGFLLATLFSELVSYAMYFHIADFLLHYIIVTRGDNVPFMMNYTQYATVISIAMGFSFFILISKNMITFSHKLFYSLVIILSAFNLLILNSLTGYFLLFFSILIVSFIIYKKYIKKILLFGTCMILIVSSFAYIASPTFKNKITSSLQTIKELSSNNFSTSIGVRIGFISYSIDIIKQHPILGLGTGDHVYEVRKNIVENEQNPINIKGMLKNIPDTHGSNLHNQFLDLLLQFGIVGLIVFLNIFYQIQKSYPSQNFLKPLPYLLIVNILLASFANPLFIFGDVEKIFILLVALCIQPFNKTSSNELEQNANTSS